MASKTEISPDDTYALIHHEIMENGLNKDAIKSMNNFYEIGLTQILRSIFRIEETFTNTRIKTPEDRMITKIRFRIQLNNIRLKAPITSGFSSGKEKPINPLQATLEDRTYSSGLIMDAHIEAWAYESGDGKVQHREATVTDHQFANLPTMVGTKLCNTYGKGKETLEMIHENPYDEGGYFIGNGKEWSIDNMESVAYNQERIFLNYGHRNELWRVEFISKPGDTYQNSKQIIFRGISGGGLTIELGSMVRPPQVKNIQFPFYMIFRAFGISTDRIMFDYILHAPAPYPHEELAGAESKMRTLTKLEQAMYDLLQAAMFADYDSKTQKFGSPIAIHSQAEVLEYLVTHLPRETFHDMDLTREEHLHQAIIDFQAMLDSNMPHNGEDESARSPKTRSIGRLIRRALLVQLGLREETDRNSYRDKRIHTPGASSSKILKTHFGHVQSQARKQLIKDFKSISFAAVNLQQSFKISFNGADLERLMLQSITSGNQASLVVNKVRRIINRLSSQLRDNKNQLKNISTGRMIISPSGETNKSSDQAKLMRMPHPSTQGFTCLIQSPEGGEKVGLHKQIAIGASISTYGSSELLKKQILAMPNVRPLADVHSYEMDIWRPILVNGEWFACTNDTAELVWTATLARRASEIDKECTIQWDNVDDEILFWVDYGRMLRPLHIVVNNVRDWKYLGLKQPVDYKDFEQHIVMTTDVLAAMRAGKLTMADLFAMQIFEWITPAEQIRLDIAVDLTLLREHRHNPLRQFTHCDIPESMLGVAALTGILNNYNHTPRNTFSTSQVRQAGSIYVNNWAYRVDKDTFLQYQVGRPLTFSRVNEYITPNGDNGIVAVMTYTGYNEEDSTVWGKWVSERLKYNGSWFTYDKVELDKPELFARPDISRTTGIKKYARYTKLDKNGIIPVGTVVVKNDVVVGKIRRLTKQVAAERKMEFQDSSKIYNSEFPSIVHSVVIAKDDHGVTFVKIGYRSLKPIIIGDKFSARCFTPDHEVLTLQHGWIPIAEVQLEDKVATLDPAGTIVYVCPRNTSSYNYDGDLMCVDDAKPGKPDTSKIAYSTTMEHKQYVKTARNGYVLLESKDLMGSKELQFKRNSLGSAEPERKTHTIPGCDIMFNKVITHFPPITVPMDAWILFFGLYITEGHVDKVSSWTSINIDKPRVQAILDDISPRLGWAFKHYIGVPRYDYNIRQVAEYLKPFGYSTEKSLPEWAVNLDVRQSKLMLHSLLMGDGHEAKAQPGKMEYYTGSQQLAEDAGHVVINCGWTFSASVKHKAGEKLEIKGVPTTRSTNQIRMIISKCERTAIAQGEPKVKKAAISRVVYKGPVHCLEVPSGIFMVRKKAGECPRMGFWTGNSGQKTICGLCLPQEDMPFMEDGTGIHILMNPHSFPKRMTNGQIYETQIGSICAKRGITCDLTTFRKIEIDDIVEETKKLGLEPFGRRRIYSGITGMWMDALIFTGTVHYQRLQKFVARQIYSIDIGPTDIITRQPLDGKANQGGLRISELQRDVFLSHGAARFFSEKMFNDSDDFAVDICQCGNRAILNEEVEIYSCPECGDMADIVSVRSCWTSKQLFMELAAMGVGVRTIPEPPTYYQTSD